MQRATGQYDHLARFPSTGPRQSRGRRSFAARHWRRAAPRCSRGMEPTVRNPRIESAIGLEAARSSHLSRRFPSAGSRNPCRRERNFWMQRPEAQNPPERPFLSAETGNVENRRKISAETASFRSTTVSAVREDWMVVCAVVCEPVSAAIPHWKPRQSAVFRFL